MTTTYHRLPAELMSGLAASTGGPAASRALAEAQFSKHLLLIADLLGRWPGPVGEQETLVNALEAARAAAPDAVARVLGSPMVGAWVAIVCRAVAQGHTQPTDLAHLGAVAAVACAAAGVDVETTAPIRDGAVALPGRGKLLVSDNDTGTARLVVADGVLTVDTGRGPVDIAATEAWLPVRTLRAGSGDLAVELTLDDVDPYRHGYHAPPSPRLTTDEFDRWQALFTEAWGLLTEHIPYRAAEIATGLGTLVPLQHDGKSSRSATIRNVFGVFGLTRPDTAPDFAVTLVHEYQHSKLSALLDLTQLSSPTDDRRYFAPWRTDPRPLAGLLQGVYAFAGVADTWRALRGADDLAEHAEQAFADARLQVDRSLASVESSEALLPGGEQFVTQLRQFTDSLLEVPVPAAAAERAELRQQELHRRWVLANGS